MFISPMNSAPAPSNTVKFGGIRRRIFQGLAIPLLILPAVAADTAPKATSVASPAAHSAIGKVEQGLKPFMERFKISNGTPTSQADVFCQNGRDKFTQVSHKVDTPQDPVGATQAALDACRGEGRLPTANITVIDPDGTFKPFAPPNWKAYQDHIAAITPDGKVQGGQLLVQVDPGTQQITSLNIGMFDEGPYAIKSVGKTTVYQFDDTQTVGLQNGGNKLKFTPTQLAEVPQGYFRPH